MDHVHLIKLSVGSENVDGLADWQARHRANWPDGLPRHVTRMWPRREKELLGDGSIYWVIGGFICCRQKILRLDEARGEDGIRRCALVLDPELIRTAQAIRRPFQGWRYLAPQDAPPDLAKTRENEAVLPVALAGALSDIGLI